MNVSNCPKFYILFTSSFWYSKKYAVNDQLILYDGNSKAAPKIGEYCGPIFPPRSISLTNEVFIWFQSDVYGGTNIGFELKYEPYSKFSIFPWVTWLVHPFSGRGFKFENWGIGPNYLEKYSRIIASLL